MLERYIATGEVSSLEHELGNHTVEFRARVSETLLTGAESTKVFSGFRDDILKEIEVYAARLFYPGLVMTDVVENI